jgi:hypothetical protein
VKKGLEEKFLGQAIGEVVLECRFKGKFEGRCCRASDDNRAVLPAPPPSPDHNGMSDGTFDIASRQRSHRQPLRFTVKLVAPALDASYLLPKGSSEGAHGNVNQVEGSRTHICADPNS